MYHAGSPAGDRRRMAWVPEMRRPKNLQFTRSSGAVLCLLGGLASSPLAAQEYHVEPIFETAINPGANVDSAAVWRDKKHPERSLLFVSAKDHDRIEVYRAATGLPHD